MTSIQDDDTIRDQTTLDLACRKISQEIDTQITARLCTPLLPEVTVTYGDDSVDLEIPDHMLGVPFGAFRQLVLRMIDPDQPIDLYRDFLDSSAFRRSNIDRMEARLDLRPPRSGRDLRSSFSRVTRAMGLDLPFPKLGWSDRIPHDFFVSRTLGYLVVASDHTKDPVSKLDAIMVSAVRELLDQGWVQ